MKEVRFVSSVLMILLILVSSVAIVSGQAPATPATPVPVNVDVPSPGSPTSGVSGSSSTPSVGVPSPINPILKEKSKGLYDYMFFEGKFGVKGSKLYYVNRNNPDQLGTELPFATSAQTQKVIPYTDDKGVKAKEVVATQDNEATLQYIKQGGDIKVEYTEDPGKGLTSIKFWNFVYKDSEGRLYDNSGKYIGGKSGSGGYQFIESYTELTGDELKKVFSGADKDYKYYVSPYGQLSRKSKEGKVEVYSDVLIYSSQVKYENDKKKALDAYYAQQTSGKTFGEQWMDDKSRTVLVEAAKYDPIIKEKLSIAPNNREDFLDPKAVKEENELILPWLEKSTANVEKIKILNEKIFYLTQDASQLNYQIYTINQIPAQIAEIDKQIAAIELTPSGRNSDPIGYAALVDEKNKLIKQKASQESGKQFLIAEYSDMNIKLKDLKSQLALLELEKDGDSKQIDGVKSKNDELIKKIRGEIESIQSIQKPSASDDQKLLSPNYNIRLINGYQIYSSEDGKINVLRKYNDKGEIVEQYEGAAMQYELNKMLPGDKQGWTPEQIEARQGWQRFWGTLLGGPRGMIDQAFVSKLNEQLGWTAAVDKYLESAWFKPEQWEVLICQYIIDEDVPDDVKMGSDSTGVQTIVMRLQAKKDVFPKATEEGGISGNEYLYQLQWMVRPQTKPMVYSVCLGGCGAGCMVPQNGADLKAGPGESSGDYYAVYLSKDVGTASICYREEIEEDDDKKLGPLQEYSVPVVQDNYEAIGTPGAKTEQSSGNGTKSSKGATSSLPGGATTI